MILTLVAFAIGVLGLILLLYMYQLAKQENIKKHTLSFPEFPKSFGSVTIFFISDIHKRSISESFIDSIKDKVDVVIIGGDLTEKNVPLERVSENINKLKQLGLTFFVWGNNDYEIDYHELDALLLQNGVKILDNSSYLFESEAGDKLELIGVDDLVHQRDRLDLAMENTSDDSFKILISHEPQIVTKFSKEAGISLVLSGHTHGGQIRIFGFGPHEKGGIKHLSHTTLLVSNGFGTTLVPFRLGAEPETHLIKITTK
ncbi:putative metallophosphoesterase [Bacillus sp. THAF10]|uniref:metallophosphoesterase n=1 Tax=Bacillus sp. THAF10 TaxID=2587848 RepID=UPI001268EAD6|nr:metallophosphoesterase [Bacillus sp. THAF10]QFT89434.1 putative metallophosphoesterase [Bacillus sp. THAF10]